MKSELDNMEFIGDHGKSFFSGVGKPEAGFECVNDYFWKRERVETVPADRCFDKEQRNVTVGGEDIGI